MLGVNTTILKQVFSDLIHLNASLYWQALASDNELFNSFDSQTEAHIKRGAVRAKSLLYSFIGSTYLASFAFLIIPVVVIACFFRATRSFGMTMLNVSCALFSISVLGSFFAIFFGIALGAGYIVAFITAGTCVASGMGSYFATAARVITLSAIVYFVIVTQGYLAAFIVALIFVGNSVAFKTDYLYGGIRIRGVIDTLTVFAIIYFENQRRYEIYGDTMVPPHRGH
jgi:hypothetical protein